MSKRSQVKRKKDSPSTNPTRRNGPTSLMKHIKNDKERSSFQTGLAGLQKKKNDSALILQVTLTGNRNENSPISPSRSPVLSRRKQSNSPCSSEPARPTVMKKIESEDAQTLSYYGSICGIDSPSPCSALTSHTHPRPLVPMD